MNHRYPCGTVNRRAFLAASAASVPLLSSLPLVGAAGEEPQARISKGSTHVGAPADLKSKFGAPGLYPGRVVEVKNPAMIQQRRQEPRGHQGDAREGPEGADRRPDAVDAWRTFFEPGDVVGIKVVPNGQPYAHSSFELVLEVIEGLKSAGVKTKDIFVYDRYRGEFMDAGYHKILPADIRWGGLTPEGGDQFQVDFPSFRNDPIAGYDPDAFVWMDLIPYGDDPKDDRKYRSHLGKLVTKVVNKIVAIPVLKDHGSAGVTGALKNMSHGSVNNVARSHSNTFTNVCNQFIPQVVSHPIDPLEVRPPDHGRHPRRLPGRAVRLGDDKGKWTLGVQRPLARHRPGGARPRRVGHRRRQARAGEAAPGRRLGQDRARPAAARRDSTSASRSTSPWPALWAWATSTTSRPARPAALDPAQDLTA